MKKPIFTLVTLFFVITVLFGVKTVVSNKLSTSGPALGRAQDEINKYKTENAILKEKVFGLSSLNHVSSVAAKLGFVESKDTFALTKGMPIALKQ